MLKMSDAMVFQAVGAIIMLAGMWIFLKDQRTGETSGTFGPFSLTLTTPSLLFFLVGATLFVFPFTTYFRSSSRPDIHSDDKAILTKSSSSPSPPVQVTPTPPSTPAWLNKLRTKQENIYLRLCDVDSEKMFQFERWLKKQVGDEKVSITKETPGDTYTTWSYISWGGSDQDIGRGLSQLLREDYGLDVPALPKRSDTTGSIIIIDIAGAKCVDTSRAPGPPAPVEVIN